MLRLRQIRKEKGMNQESLAAAIGMSQSNISEIENGRHNPTLDTLTKIADALGVPVSGLFEVDRSDTINRIVDTLRTLDEDEKSQIASLAEMIASRRAN